MSLAVIETEDRHFVGLHSVGTVDGLTGSKQSWGRDPLLASKQGKEQAGKTAEQGPAPQTGSPTNIPLGSCQGHVLKKPSIVGLLEGRWTHGGQRMGVPLCFTVEP